MLLCAEGELEVSGVTQLDDIVYFVCQTSSTIARFDATTHERLPDISVTGMSRPWDIAACARPARLYVTDSGECVWRVSGADTERWLIQSPSDPFRPRALSLTSSRLLVTPFIESQLRQFDAAGGDELRRVGLPDYMSPYHAVESPTGTFIVGYNNRQLNQCQVSEVNTEGQVLRQFSGSSLGCPIRVAVDRQGNIFVADSAMHHILLLDAQLALRRVIIDERQLNDRRPRRLCYLEPVSYTHLTLPTILRV